MMSPRERSALKPGAVPGDKRGWDFLKAAIDEERSLMHEILGREEGRRVRLEHCRVVGPCLQGKTENGEQRENDLSDHGLAHPLPYPVLKQGADRLARADGSDAE